MAKIMFKKPIGGMADLTLNNRKRPGGRGAKQDRGSIQESSDSDSGPASTTVVVRKYIERSRFESHGCIGCGRSRRRWGGGIIRGLGDIPRLPGPVINPNRRWCSRRPGRALESLSVIPRSRGPEKEAAWAAQNKSRRIWPKRA